MRDPKAEGKRWLEQATRDLQAAEIIFEENLWWIACFEAQQAAEKAVKAFLYASGERVVIGHSVAELVKQAAEKNPAFRDLAAAASRLDRFYIPTRYPNSLPGGIPADAYTTEDAQQALQLARRILEFARDALMSI
jgi:HEPN domain-containing protein